MAVPNKKVFFHFLKQGTAGFDRIFSIFFFQAIAIDLVTNESLNQELELPYYTGQYGGDAFTCKPIKEKLNDKELKAVTDFVEREKGRVETKAQALKQLQAEFGLTDCDISF